MNEEETEETGVKAETIRLPAGQIWKRQPKKQWKAKLRTYSM